MSESRLTDSPFPIDVFIIEKRRLAIPTALIELSRVKVKTRIGLYDSISYLLLIDY